MSAFFQHQLDYIYFLYGLSFLLVAEACFNMRRPAPLRLPWVWLGLFGILHGAHEWIDLFVLSTGDNARFTAARALLLILSFLCLAEFGRAAAAGILGKGPGRWALAVLLVLPAFGYFRGVAGIEALARYSLGLVGGLWAAAALYLASRTDHDEGKWLMLTAVSMGLYALAAGLVVSGAGFYPSDTINNETFFRAAGVPIQLVRGALAISVSVGIMFFYRTHVCNKAENRGEPRCLLRPVIILVGIVIAGWFAAESAGRHAEREVRDGLLARTLTAAAAVDPDRVGRLAGARADDGRPDFEYLKDQLESIRNINPDCRFIYLMRLRDDGKFIFLVDSEPKGSKDYSPPGQVYDEALPRDFEYYRRAEPAFYEPYTDSWGTWVSGAAYIHDRTTGKVLALLGTDVDAKVWFRETAIHRLYWIMLTLALSVLSMVLQVARQRGREAEAQRTALTVAKELDRQRTDFYAMVAHDLKTPLTAIRGYADMLLIKDAGFDADSAQMIRSIRDCGNKLMRMANDFSIVSRPQTEKVQLNEGLEDVKALLSRLHEEFVVAAGKKGVELASEVSRDIPEMMLDRVYMERAVANLMQNAINYTPPGGEVGLGAELEDADGRKRLVVTVTDTGPGMPPDEKDRIFQKYYRSPKSAGVGGSGLGLAIVKAVAEAHGGKVEVESAPGKGSAFRLSIPMRRPQD